MPEYNIECRTCGGPYVARRSDAKQCASCRLLRVLTYAASKTRARKCRACAELYAPARLNDRACGTCTPIPARQANIKVTCALCKKDTAPFERVPVCPCCAKGVETQPTIIRMLKKGQAQRKAANLS